MDLSSISKKFTHDTLIEIAKNAGLGCKNLRAEFTDSNTKKGDSYLSVIHRLKVISDDGEVKVLVKTLPHNMVYRKTFRCAEFFENEINFYAKIIPKLMEFQKSTGSEDIFAEYPQHLSSYCDGENDFVVLRDINVDGFLAPSRQNYTETELCALILKTLGRFHAVSLALKDQQPEEFAKLTQYVHETYYRENLRSWYGGFLKLACSVAIDAIKQTYPNSEYEKKAERFLQANLYDDMISMVNNRTKFAVIGHGDCWRPNFLAKFDETESKAKEVKIIDFQLVRYGSPICDIMFFLYNSTSQEQREKHFDELIRSYHESAADLIRKLGSNPDKVFPYEDLKEELQQFGRFGCGFCIESLPLSMLDDDDVADMDSVELENTTLLDFWKIKPIENAENRQRLADVIRHAIDNSYIV